MSTNKKNLRVDCPNCNHWNWIPVNKVFFEPSHPEPKVRVMIPMYKPIEATNCSKCGKVIAKPDELFRIVKGLEAIKYRIKNCNL